MFPSLRAALDWTLRPAPKPAPPWPRPWVERSRPAPTGRRAMSATEFEAFQLWTFGEADVPAVRVTPPLHGAVAPACRHGAGVVLSVEAAMRDRPLPHATAGGAACRCAYVPVQSLAAVLRHGRR